MLSTKRRPSVNATLRKPASSFCSPCEALVASKSPNSKKRPPILPGGRFLSQPGLVVFVSSVTFGEPGPSAKPMGGTGAGIRYSPRCRSRSGRAARMREDAPARPLAPERVGARSRDRVGRCEFSAQLLRHWPRSWRLPPNNTRKERAPESVMYMTDSTPSRC